MKNTSLYVHIPFCTRKCLFCSFVVAIGQEHRRDDYVQALVTEAQHYKGTHVQTIYLGGGTPSLLSEAQLNLLMDEFRRCFVIAPDAQISIEANPEGITLLKARCLKNLGFNRVSLGIQSMDERYLKFLGRIHDTVKALQAYHTLREAGFHNINLDLMYAFPGQTVDELQDDVHTIASLGSEHLSLYTLTIEPHSRFYATQMKLDDEAKIAAQYSLIADLLPDYGFNQYEVSNFAKPGFESLHNMNYWLGGSYIGLGVGAHGYMDGRRYWNADKLQIYLDGIISKGRAVEGYEDLTEETRVMEKVLFGLRMNKGINWDLLPVSKHNQVRDLIQAGFLSLENSVLKATNKGRLVLDEISARLI